MLSMRAVTPSALCDEAGTITSTLPSNKFSFSFVAGLLARAPAPPALCASARAIASCLAFSAVARAVAAACRRNSGGME